MKTRMTRTGIAITPSEIRDLATPLTDDASLDPLLASIGDARFVLLGEASHGEAEYYRRRAALTQRLIAKHDFPSSGWKATGPTASSESLDERPGGAGAERSGRVGGVRPVADLDVGK
jgi:hypothetical protein